MTAFARDKYSILWDDHALSLGNRTLIMGVLNVTPDSFSDGGRFFGKEQAVEQALSMAGEGADIIDIGGESTRPYSEEVSCDEELRRIIPVIEALVNEVKIPISIDTCKAEVARKALDAGASMVNDISALRFDPEMASVAAGAGVPVILMHMKGTPGNMQDNPRYDNLMSEISDFLRDSIERAEAGGIPRDMIIIDPGIGFGKTIDHNLEIIKELNMLRSLERPVLLGTSRKAFIGSILGNEPHMRDTGTMASVSAGIMNGAHIVRVHNVKKAVETAKMIDAIISAASGDANVN